MIGLVCSAGITHAAGESILCVRGGDAAFPKLPWDFLLDLLLLTTLLKVPANHLLSASLMSAPAALAMSKLSYPETKKSRTTAELTKAMDKGYVEG